LIATIKAFNLHLMKSQVIRTVPPPMSLLTVMMRKLKSKIRTFSQHLANSLNLIKEQTLSPSPQTKRRVKN